MFLVYEHYFSRDTPSICEIGKYVSCERVLRSSWAIVFGVPVAVHGLTYFVVSCALSACCLLLRDFRAVRDATLMSLCISAIGFIACLHLVVIEWMLGAICPLCTMVHAVVTVCFFFYVWLVVKQTSYWRMSWRTLREIVVSRVSWILLIFCVVGSPFIACNVLVE